MKKVKIILAVSLAILSLSIIVYMISNTNVKLKDTNNQILVEKKNIVVNNNVRVTIDSGIIGENTTISIEPIKIDNKENLRVINSYDIGLDTKQEIDGIITIELPFNKNLIKNDEKVGAVYFNETTSEYEDVLFEINDNRIVIYTDHLSTYAVVAKKTGVGISSVVGDSSIPNVNLDEATIEKILKETSDAPTVNSTSVKVAWKLTNEHFGIFSTTLGFLEDGLGMDCYKELNSSLSKIGLGLAFIQLGQDLYKEDYTGAVINASKNGYYYGISKWGAKGLKVASVSVFMIDYYLTKGAETLLEDRYQLYYDGYKRYMNSDTRKMSTNDWYKLIYNMSSNVKTQEDFSSQLNTYLDTYLNQAWSDPEYNSYLDMKLSGGLNDEVQKQIVKEYRMELMKQKLGVSLNHLINKLNYENQKQLQTNKDNVNKILNQKYKVRIKLDNKSDIENNKIKIKLLSSDNKEIKTTSFKTNEIELTMTLKGYLERKANTIQLIVPGKENITKTFKLNKPEEIINLTFTVGENESNDVATSIIGTWKWVDVVDKKLNKLNGELTYNMTMEFKSDGTMWKTINNSNGSINGYGEYFYEYDLKNKSIKYGNYFLQSTTTDDQAYSGKVLPGYTILVTTMEEPLFVKNGNIYDPTAGLVVGKNYDYLLYEKQ